MKRTFLHKRILSPEQEAEIVRRYVAGESSSKIARSIVTKTGVVAGLMLIWRVLKRNGVALRSQIIPEEKRHEIIELSKIYTAAEVAKKLDVSIGSVLRITKQKNEKQTNRGRKRKFTTEQEAAIARRYETGDESISAIAETLDVTRMTISAVLSRQGIKIRHHQHALTPNQEEEVVRRFTEGETSRDLERYFGVDHTSINRIVHRRGGPLRRCGRKRHFESREEWMKQPAIRLRKLLQTAKANALKMGRAFDDKLFDVFAVNHPTVCACCGVQLDYSVYARNKMFNSRTPSLDRCDNSLGYIVGNVYILCLRCNLLKSDATFDELIKLAAYVKRHLDSTV